MRTVRAVVIALLLALLVPTAAAAAYFYAQGWPQRWNSADWSTTNTAPDPVMQREAIIQVYAARAGRWKGVMAVHTWIALKPKDAPAFTRFDVVGWGEPVVRNRFPVDGLWFSNHAACDP